MFVLQSLNQFQALKYFFFGYSFIDGLPTIVGSGFLQLLLCCRLIMILSSFESVTSDPRGALLQIFGYSLVLLSPPIGFQAILIGHLLCINATRICHTWFDLLLIQNIWNSPFYVFIKRFLRFYTAYVKFRPFLRQLESYSGTDSSSMDTFSVCTSLSKGITVSSKDIASSSTCSWNAEKIFNTSHHERLDIFIVWLPHRNLFVLCVACFCVYASQEWILVLKFFGHFRTTFLQVFHVKIGSYSLALEVGCLPQVFDSKLFFRVRLF